MLIRYSQTMIISTWCIKQLWRHQLTYVSVLYKNHINVIKFTFVNRFFFSQLLESLYYLPPTDIEIDTHILVSKSLFTSEDALSTQNSTLMLILGKHGPLLSLADDWMIVCLATVIILPLLKRVFKITDILLIVQDLFGAVVVARHNHSWQRDVRLAASL